MTNVSHYARIPMTKKLHIIIAYFLIYVVWGSTYYFIGIALNGFPTFLLGALRFSIAGIILLIACVIRKEKVFAPSLVQRSAISGIILLFIDMAVIMLAQRYVSSSLVAIVASSTAIWIMLLDFPKWKCNFKKPIKVAGILLGFIGVGMLYLEQFLSTESSTIHYEYGILILIAGCISWSIGTLYTKYKTSDIENTNEFASSAWQMLFAGSMFWICTLLFDNLPSINIIAIPIKAWLSLIYLITFGSLLAYSAYVWLLKVRPATEVATHAYVNPVIAVVIGTGFGNENVTTIQLLGLLIILLSVMSITKINNEI